MLTRQQQRVWLILVLCLSAVLQTVVALKMSHTDDETTHTRYGANVLAGHPARDYAGHYYDSQMPISALNAIPGRIAQSLDAHKILPSLSATLSDYHAARFPTIFAALVLNLLVYLWAYDLYGADAALAACLVSVFAPNLIAHGTVATTDMFHAVGVVASLYFFRRFLLQPTVANTILSGLVLGLAQTTKPFAIFLYPVIGLVLLISLVRRDPSDPLTKKRVMLYAAVAALSFIVVLNVVYSFDRTFARLGTYQFETEVFRKFQRTPLRRSVLVPVPYPFLQGLDMTKFNEGDGNSFGNVFLLGHLRYAKDPAFHGFKSYYAVAYFFKEAIPITILFVWGLVWICRHRRFRDFLGGEGPLLTAAALLVFWLSFFSRAQIGIRHILPALAIETVIAGAAFAQFSSKSRAQKLTVVGLASWLVVSVASYYPRMIPYMNEWVHDRRYAYRLLGDSNLDWSQDTDEVQKFLTDNPDVLLNPGKLVAGRVLINANRLTGVDRWNPPESYYAERYKPIAQVGYAHFLFVVPAGDLKNLPQ